MDPAAALRQAPQFSAPIPSMQPLYAHTVLGPPQMSAPLASAPAPAAAPASRPSGRPPPLSREEILSRKRDRERARLARKRAEAAARTSGGGGLKAPVGTLVPAAAAAAAAAANSSSAGTSRPKPQPPRPQPHQQPQQQQLDSGSDLEEEETPQPAAKRVRRALASSAAGSVAAGEADAPRERMGSATNAAAATSGSGPAAEPSSSVWSILADLVWLPRFLSVVHTQVSSGRTPALNAHMLAATWRQKLVEGGWAKETHYLLKGHLPESADDAATVAASGAHLVKSRRAVSDFTPTVCQQLWRIVAYQRDPSPQAALELAAAAAKHRALEERCRQLALPLMVGGKPTALPQDAPLKLERLYGLPPGGLQQVAERRHPATNSATASGSTSNLSVGEDDGSDVEDTFEYFPGVWDSTPLHSARFRLDGATIDRWAKGWHVHVPPPRLGGPCRPEPTGLAPTTATTPSPLTDAVRTALEDPNHPHHASVASLSSRAQLTGLLNESQRAFRQQVARNQVLLDLDKREWDLTVAPIKTGSSSSGSGGGGNSNSAPHHHPLWTSPHDDENLLDSLADWLVRQPRPTLATFGVSAADGSPLLHSAALLPQSTSDWMSIRHACAAHHFSLAFLRRRMWLLCQEANLFDAAQIDAAEAAAASSAAAGAVDSAAAAPPAAAAVVACTNPSLERLAAKVGSITSMLTERMAHFAAEQAKLKSQQPLQQQQQPHAAAEAPAKAEPSVKLEQAQEEAPVAMDIASAPQH